MNIKIIGLGGIGSSLSLFISRYINYSDFQSKQITLIDGKRYEPRKAERQEFSNVGNKSEVKVSEFRRLFSNVNYESIPTFVTENNISELIEDGDIVFLGVDNHKTRKIVSDYCSKLNNVTLISGGNELTDGNVQLYVRERGVDITPSLTQYHPEIQSPKDKLPSELSCEELLHSEPQIYFTNLSVAAYMCMMFYNVVNKNYGKSEVYFDVLTMSSHGKMRSAKQ
jgi:molybdopterin/thiamine biosynthesis adenylyltransferase